MWIICLIFKHRPVVEYGARRITTTCKRCGKVLHKIEDYD